MILGEPISFWSGQVPLLHERPRCNMKSNWLHLVSGPVVHRRRQAYVQVLTRPWQGANPNLLGSVTISVANLQFAHGCTMCADSKMNQMPVCKSMTKEPSLLFPFRRVSRSDAIMQHMFRIACHVETQHICNISKLYRHGKSLSNVFSPCQRLTFY